jgi:hypothetical protein
VGWRKKTVLVEIRLWREGVEMKACQFHGVVEFSHGFNSNFAEIADAREGNEDKRTGWQRIRTVSPFNVKGHKRSMPENRVIMFDIETLDGRAFSEALGEAVTPLLPAVHFASLRG